MTLYLDAHGDIYYLTLGWFCIGIKFFSNKTMSLDVFHIENDFEQRLKDDGYTEKKMPIKIKRRLVIHLFEKWSRRMG
jgi:hypothetical protein